MQNFPIRVLQVVTAMGRGGLETMLMNYYRKINREKIQFDFLEHREIYTDYDAEIERLGGRIYRLPGLNPFSKKYVSMIEGFFKEHTEYKIVHSHVNSMSGLVLAYARNAGVPIRIAHSHSTREEYDWKYLIKRYYKEQIKKAATDRMACGCEAGKWLFGGGDFMVLNNAIHTDVFLYQNRYRESVRKSFGIGGNDFVVGHVGRFSREKNHAFLAEIFREIHKEVPGSRLLLVGEGSLQERIREKVLKWDLEDSVIFTGVSDKIWELLSAMDAFVMPSLYEGLPVTLIEAQASGLKCFMSDAIPKEVILTDDVSVLRLRDGAGKWAEKICHVAEGYERKNRKEEIVSAGYDVDANVKRLEGYYITRIAFMAGKGGR